METKTAESVKELSVLCDKAKTKEGYREIIRKREGIETALEEDPSDVKISVLYSSYFAEYYLFLKQNIFLQKLNHFLKVI